MNFIPKYEGECPPIINGLRDWRITVQDDKCQGYHDRYHHDGGNEHYDRYNCERPKGHKGDCLDYILPEDKK